jgi:hypothetical protein
MAPIPMPLSSSPGFHGLQESSGRLINLFAVPLGEQRGAKRVRVPGLTTFLTSTATGFRGMYAVSGILYVAFAEQLYTGTSAGGPLLFFDDLPGTTRVYFASNNASPPDVVVVTENGAFLIDDPSAPNTVIPYTDPDLPQPSTVFSLDGYLTFTIGDGRIFATDLNQTAVNPLSFGRLEAKPDPPVRGVPFAGRALFFGSQTLEVWTDVGTSPFPFQRAVVVPFGLLGVDAVAGWEDGWGAGLLWVAHDGTVRQLNGYTADKVSPPDLDQLIAREPNPELLLASVYMVDGHAMWSITGSNFTWSFDINTQKWHERESYLTNRWRGLQTWNAFGRWLVGDRGRVDVYNPGEYLDDGNVYEIDPTNHEEAGESLRARLESGPVQQFPQRVRVARADFNLETGVGVATGTDPNQTDPTVEISWSDDGGISWSDPMLRKLGRQSVNANISVFRTGMSSRHGRRWRLDISDAIYVSIFGGDQSTEMRRG